MPTKKKPTEPKSEIAVLPYGQLAEQYALPIEQIRKLVRSSQKLSEATLLEAVLTAKMFGVPLQGINVIPSSQGPGIYINSDGIRWLIHNNPRGLKSIETEIIHRPTKEEISVEVKVRTTFKDGSFFDGIGACMIDKQWDPANATMKAETKAERRSGYKATGKVLPSYEDQKDYIEYRETEIKDVTPQIKAFANSNHDAPSSLAELITRSGLGLEELCAKLQVASVAEIKDFHNAWEKLKPAE